MLGSWSFYGLDLRRDRRALVPRPETEVLVDRCLALLDGATRPGVADVGTGTGAIALAIAACVPGAEVAAIDVSGEALALAAENAASAGLTDRLELLQGNLLAPVAGRRFDLVASNPPYVAPGESVDPEVADFEPGLAVYAEDAGRAIIGRLAVDALTALHPGGHLVVEVADGQAPWLAESLAGLGYEAIAVTRDLRGIERVVEAQLPP